VDPRFGITRKAEASDERRRVIAVKGKRSQDHSVAKADGRAYAVRFTLKPDRLPAIKRRKAFDKIRPKCQRFVRRLSDRSKWKFGRCRIRKNTIEQRVHKSFVETDREFLSPCAGRH